MKVAVLRPADAREESEAAIRQAGLEPVMAPALEMEETPPDRALMERAGAADIVIFVSPRAARLFFEAYAHAPSFPPSGTVISIGAKTHAELRRHGVESLMPSGHSSSGIVSFVRKMRVKGTAAIIRSREGSSTLSDGLRALGLATFDVPLYGARYPRDDGALKSLVMDIERGGVYAIPFTSAMTARNFFRCAGANCSMPRFMEGLGACSLWSIGPETSVALSESGVSFTEAGVADFGAIVRAIASFREHR